MSDIAVENSSEARWWDLCC